MTTLAEKASALWPDATDEAHKALIAAVLTLAPGFGPEAVGLCDEEAADLVAKAGFKDAWVTTWGMLVGLARIADKSPEAT